MKILIVGNGSIGVDGRNGFFINNHTGEFLVKVDKCHDLTFIQNVSEFKANNNLQNFDLLTNNLKFKLVNSNRNYRSLFELYKNICENELIYLFFPGTLARIAGLFCVLLNKKVGLYIRGQYFNQNSLDRVILKFSKFILTVSPHFIEGLSAYCRDVDVISPMISLVKEDFIVGRDFSEPKKWNLLFVGRVERRKGIFDLLEIARSLKQNNLQYQLNIVGGGDLFDELESLIITEHLTENIVLHGQVSDKNQLSNLYKAADAFVFTSHDEGFPRVLYEAMASCLPIFTTFVGGIGGRMVDKDNCVEIPVKNGVLASKIILENLKDLEKLKRIAENGQQTLSDVLSGRYLHHDELFLKKISKYDK